jgi:hypothetical protein
MEQSVIKEILDEAVTADSNRILEIQILLTKSVGGTKEDDIVKIVLNTLFIQTHLKDPTILPSLFPFFSLVCGNKKVTEAVIDWSQYQP